MHSSSVCAAASPSFDVWEPLDPWLFLDRVELGHVSATCTNNMMLVRLCTPFASLSGVSYVDSALSTAEMDAEWALLEPCLESFCLAAFPGKIESLIVAPEHRERVLDEHAEKGMAAIQKCFTTSEGNLMIYRHFHRLRRALRRRIASMAPG